MPNSISNHFAITALQEGITVQGSLRINGSLSQNFNPRSGTAVPDWKGDASTRPSLYPVIRRGSVYMSKNQIFQAKWYYNDIQIQFGADGKSTNFKDAANDPLFHLGTTTVELGGVDVLVEELTIISNLASEGNTDLDSISYQGSVELNGKQLQFPMCSVDVKIAEMSTQGYLGLLSPESAIISAKTGAGSSVTFKASLYDDSGRAPASWFCKWYDAGTGTEISNSADKKQLTFTESDVTDNLVIRVDFFTDSAHTNKVTSAFASIDDTQDPEYLYISMNGSNSDFSGQLSPGESVIVTAWVATMEDSTAINTAYNTFGLKLYNGNQGEISGGPSMTVTNHKGSVTIGYDFVAQNGYKIMGIVTAQ